jgi:DNA-binding transcriptional LysR family regulator
MALNVHQLELFYHVVVNQGVSQAARVLDKEQPTLSKQINDLEDALRVKLYHRRPFKLTEKGEVLFKAVEGFFKGLPKLEQQLRGGDMVRMGASPIFLMDHLPAIEKQVRKRFPALHLVLREANQPQLVQWVEHGEIDLAITLLPRETPQKMFVQPLVPLPLILLAPKNSPITSAEQLWKDTEVAEPLVCLTPNEMICQEFQQALARMDIEWRPTIEVGSMRLVEHYVQEGYGLGLSLRVPGGDVPEGLREIALPDFPVLALGMMWRDNEDRLVKAFREQVELRAKEVAG